MNWKVFCTFCKFAETTTTPETVGKRFLQHMRNQNLSKQDRTMLRKLLTAAKWDPKAVQAFETDEVAYRIGGEDGTWYWLAPSSYPLIIPKAPRMSFLGIHRLAVGLKEALLDG